MSPPRRRLPVSPPWLPRPRVCPRLHLHRITSKGYPPARVLTAVYPVYFASGSQCLPYIGCHWQNKWTNSDRDTHGRVVLGGNLRNPRSRYFSTPVFPCFASLISQRRTRMMKRTMRTRRAMVCSARTLKSQRAKTHRQQIHARRGVTNAQDTLGCSGRNLPLFLDILLDNRCDMADAGSLGPLIRREALAARSAGVEGGGSR